MADGGGRIRRRGVDRLLLTGFRECGWGHCGLCGGVARAPVSAPVTAASRPTMAGDLGIWGCPPCPALLPPDLPLDVDPVAGPEMMQGRGARSDLVGGE
eukprot:scaffold6711_cov118-Isochrysis_galbana.AAC.23